MSVTKTIKYFFHHPKKIKDIWLSRYYVRSYSQEGEDMILRTIFDDRNEGFYVDIGAHHPKRFSNTYYFYKRGWHGINIDAMPGSMESFNQLRKRDCNLEIAISNQEQELDYYQFNESALNGFSKQISEERQGKTYTITSVTKIKTQRLEKVLDIYVPTEQKIDFMSVDVEGFDLEVLESNNWSKYRPKILVVEVLGLDVEKLSENALHTFLTHQGYTIFAKCPRSCFYKDTQA